MLFSFKKYRTKVKQPGSFFSSRLLSIKIIFAMLFIIMLGRSYYIMVYELKDNRVEKLARNQYKSSIRISPYRGEIFDRYGNNIAISIKKPSIAANPRVVKKLTKKQINRFTRILQISKKRLIKKLKRKSYFVWLKRNISFAQAKLIKNMRIKGVYQIDEPSRYYSTQTAAQLIGLVGKDNQGLFGIEKIYDKYLKGDSKEYKIFKDARRKTIYQNAAKIRPEKTGNNVYLTLDKVIQEISEKELKKAVVNSKAKSGFVIVAEPYSGKILALANYPTFNPNKPPRNLKKYNKNHALYDVFEPGSVVKPFLIGQAVNEKLIYKRHLFNCEEGSYKIGKHTINDVHESDFLNARDTIIKSSNICTYKIASKMGAENTHNALIRSGLASGELRLGWPSEARGWLSDWKKWREIRFSNISFGQGFFSTGLEVLSSMNAIANGGNLFKPSIVEKIKSHDGSVVFHNQIKPLRKILTADSAKYLRKTLRQVVDSEDGTARHARSKIYSIAGKTGTAQKVVGKKGYSRNKYIVSFVGFAPAKDPHLAMYVVIDEPGKKPYAGGYWAAPVLKEIAEQSLSYLNVESDIQSKLVQKVRKTKKRM